MSNVHNYEGDGAGIAEDERETLVNTDEEEEVNISMLIRDDPKLTLALLLYMKLYSEVLFGWGQVP